MGVLMKIIGRVSVLLGIVLVAIGFISRSRYGVSLCGVGGLLIGGGIVISGVS